MHAVLLADLAATISQHAPAIVASRPRGRPVSLSGYWSASRTRLDLWQRSLGRYARAQRDADWPALRRWWAEHTTVMEEVLVSEILTRVVASIASELDRDRGDDETSPVTHAISLAHLEARTRVQKVMIDGRGCRVPDAVRLNRLRQAVERWTDVLIGRMGAGHETIVRYAVEPERAEAYAAEARGCGVGARRNTAIWLMNAAMHDVLSRRTGPVAALPKANRQVADSVMRLFRTTLFDSFGTAKSIEMIRVESDHEGSDRMATRPIISPDSATNALDQGSAAATSTGGGGPSGKGPGADGPAADDLDGTNQSTVEDVKRERWYW